MEELGIKGYVDIDNILDSLNQLKAKLSDVSRTTEVASAKMDVALKSLSHGSANELPNILKNAVSEIQKDSAILTNAISQSLAASQEKLKAYRNELAELEDSLGKEQEGTKKYEKITNEINKLRGEILPLSFDVQEASKQLDALTDTTFKVADALRAAATSASAFDGANTDTLVSSIKTSLESLKNTVAEGKKSVEDAMSDIGLKSEQELNSAINASTDKMRHEFESVSRDLSFIISDKEQSLKALQTNIDALKAERDASQEGSVMWQQIDASLKPLIELYDQHNKILTEAKNAQSALRDEYLKTDSAASELGASLGEIYEGYGRLDIIDNLRDKAKSLGEDISKLMGDLTNAFANSNEDGVSTIITDLTEKVKERADATQQANIVARNAYDDEQKKVGELEQSIKSLTNEMNAAAERNDAKAVEEYSQRIEEQKGELESAREKLDEYSLAMKSTSENAKEAQDAIAGMQRDQDKMSTIQDLKEEIALREEKVEALKREAEAAREAAEEAKPNLIQRITIPDASSEYRNLDADATSKEQAYEKEKQAIAAKNEELAKIKETLTSVEAAEVAALEAPEKYNLATKMQEEIAAEERKLELMQQQAEQQKVSLMAPSGGLVTTEGLDTLNASIEQQQQKIGLLRDRYDEYTKSLDNSSRAMLEKAGLIEKNAKGEEDSAKAIEKVIKAETQKLIKLEEERDALAKLAENNPYDEELGAKIDAVNKAYAEQKTYLEELSAQYKGLKQDVENVSDTSLSEKIKNGASNIAEGFKKAGTAIKDWATGHGKFQEGMKDLKGSFELLPAPIGNAIKGVQGMTSAMWKMIRTPLGAVLAAIVLALQAVFKWFNKTKEGQLQFAKLSAYIGSIIDSLIDILVSLGEYIFHAFTDPQGAMFDFGKNLIQTVKTAVRAAGDLLHGLGSMLRSVWALFTEGSDAAWASFEEGWKTIHKGVAGVKDAFVGAVKTSASLFAGLGKVAWKGLSEAYDMGFDGLMDKLRGIHDTAMIAYNEAKVDSDASGLNSNADYDKQIAQKQKQIEESEGEEDALKHIDELNKLINEKYDEQIKKKEELMRKNTLERLAHGDSLRLEEERNRLIRERDMLEAKRAKQQKMALALASAETRRQEQAAKHAEAEAARAARKAEQAKKKQDREAAAAARKAEQAQKKAQREREKADKALAAEQKKQLKRTNDIAKAAQNWSIKVDENEYKYAEALAEVRSRVRSAEIDAMDESTEKRILRKDFDNAEELRKIQKEGTAAINEEIKRQQEVFELEQTLALKQTGKREYWDDSKLDTTKIEALTAEYEKLYDITQGSQLKNWIKETTDQYQTFADKRLKIEEDYNAQIGVMQEQERRARAAGYTKEADQLVRAIAEAQKKKNEALLKNDFEELKASPEYIRAFEDLGNTSTETLNALIADFEKVKASAAKNMSPEQLREFTKTLQQMYDEVDSRQSTFARLNKAMEEYKIATDNAREAQELLSRVQSGEQSIRTIKTWRVEGTKLVPVYYTLEEAQKRVNAARDEQAKKSNKVKKAINDEIKEVEALAKAINSVGKSIGGIAGDILGFVADVMTFTTGIISTVSGLAKKAASEISMLEKASVILGIVSAGIKLVQTFSKLLPSQEDYYERAVAKQKEINKMRQTIDEYRMAVIKAQQAEQNWLATDNLTSLRDAWEYHAEAEKAYANKLNEVQEKYQDKRAGLSKWIVPIVGAIAGAAAVFTGGLSLAALGPLVAGLSSGIATGITAGVAAAGGALVGAAVNSAAGAIQGYNNPVRAQDNLRIQTRHKTWFRSEKTADLRQWVKENLGADLFDENGLIDLVTAQKVLDKYGDKLVGETKDTLEELMELREEYDKFLEEIHDYVSDMFSPLLDNMSDAVWDWLTKGEDALDKFKEYSSETFADIAKDAIRQFMNVTILRPFQDELEKLYASFAAGEENGGISAEELMRRVAAISEQMVNAYEANLPAAEQLANIINSAFEQHGIDITGNSYNEDQGATSSAAEKITYDQADILIGIATATQIAVEQGNMQRLQLIESQLTLTESTINLTAYTSEINSNVNALCEMQASGLQKLDQIILNTNPIGAISSEVTRLRKYIEENL